MGPIFQLLIDYRLGLFQPSRTREEHFRTCRVWHLRCASYRRYFCGGLTMVVRDKMSWLAFRTVAITEMGETAWQELREVTESRNLGQAFLPSLHISSNGSFASYHHRSGGEQAHPLSHSICGLPHLLGRRFLICSLAFWLSLKQKQNTLIKLLFSKEYT